jgi:antitoxin VapB
VKIGKRGCPLTVNIKNQEVESLLDSVVQLTGESKTSAIRQALAERLERLSLMRVVPQDEARLEVFLQNEIWANIPERLLGTSLTKAEEETILGYGEHGI